MANTPGGCTALESALLDSVPVAVPPERRLLIVLLLALATLMLGIPSGWEPLANGAEGRNAMVARQWVLGESPAQLAEKWSLPVHPTLTTLATVQSFRWFGFTEFGARAPQVGAMLALVCLVYLISERLGGSSRGLAAGVIAVTMSGPLLHGKNAGGSSLLACCVVLAMYALVRMLEQRTRRLTWLGLFWGATTAALLEAGWLGVLVPFGVVIGLLPFFRQARVRLATFFGKTGLLLALSSGVIFYFWHRAGWGNSSPEMAYRSLIAFFWMLFPWGVALLLPALLRWRKVLRLVGMECGEAVLWLWLVVALVWVLIGGVAGEWPASVAVFWPALALVGAIIWERLTSGLKILGCSLLIVAGILGAVFCGRMAGADWLQLLQPIWWLSCAVIVLFGGAAILFIRQRHSRAALLALAAAVIPLAFNLMDARARYASSRSLRELARLPALVEKNSTPVLVDDRLEAVSAFLFYAPRGVQPHFQAGEARKELFLLAPQVRREYWEGRLSGAKILSSSATHDLWRIAP